MYLRRREDAVASVMEKSFNDRPLGTLFAPAKSPSGMWEMSASQSGRSFHRGLSRHDKTKTNPRKKNPSSSPRNLVVFFSPPSLPHPSPLPSSSLDTLLLSLTPPQGFPALSLSNLQSLFQQTNNMVRSILATSALLSLASIVAAQKGYGRFPCTSTSTSHVYV